MSIFWKTQEVPGAFASINFEMLRFSALYGP